MAQFASVPAVVAAEEDASGEQVAGTQKIIDLDRVCRTCLVENDKDGLKDLFEFGLAETVTSVVSGITIEESDGLPGHICTYCLQEVERIIGFRQQCERSDATIRELIEKSVVIKQDCETKYEVLNVVLTDADGNTETSAVVVPVEELRFQLVNGAVTAGCSSEEVVSEAEMVAPADLLVTEEIIVQSQPEDELVYAEVASTEEQQESIVMDNIRQELSEFIGGTCADIPKGQENLDVNDDDDEMFSVDYLKDALTDEYIQTMEQQLAPTGPPRSENPAQDRLEQANLDSLINDEMVGAKDGDEGGHRCDECGLDFDGLAKFRMHMKKHSENHMRHHTGEKKPKNVTCTVCLKNFAGNGDLKIHMRTHTKEKPYSCQLCEKSFMLQVHLTVHMRSHTGEKPYACTLCPKAFSTNYQLKNHMYVHTGEKNFVCEICDRRFSSAANRNTHRKTHERKIS